MCRLTVRGEKIVWQAVVHLARPSPLAHLAPPFPRFLGVPIFGQLAESLMRWNLTASVPGKNIFTFHRSVPSDLPELLPKFSTQCFIFLLTGFSRLVLTATAALQFAIFA
jgi:hypothetical protein